MSKEVIFLRNSTPDNPELGYGDYVEVKENGKALFGSHASTCPNPYRPSGTNRFQNWRACYAFLAEGEMDYECIKHNKFGKCLIVNNGGQVKTINPNRNHNGEFYATEIFVHCGGLNSANKKWRGSRGCCTIPIEYWCDFIRCFEIGDKGKMTIKKLIENKVV